MKASEAQKRATEKYEAEKVSHVTFRVSKEKKPLIAECARINEESVNEMLNRLVDGELQRVGLKQ